MRFNKFLGVPVAGLLAVVFLGAGESSCDSQTQDANEIQADQQARITREAALEVGMPAITHHREQRLLKELYELRDQSDLVTYTYIWSEYLGKYRFVCQSIGFPLPYSTQYSAPTHIVIPWVDHEFVIEDPQSEPNNLYPPSSADGTWVMCSNPDTQKIEPTYEEPRVTTLLRPLPASQVLP